VTPREFVDDVSATLEMFLALREAGINGVGEAVGRSDMPALLRMALRSQLEAAEIASLWVVSTPDVEVKLGLARLAGDEAQHYELLFARFVELGGDAEAFSRGWPEGRSKLMRYLETIETPVQRVAALPFAREAIAIRSNLQFIASCEAVGDIATAALYRMHIQPDHERHLDWGSKALERLALSERDHSAARRVVLTTLELATDLRGLATGRLSAEPLPGS
jgi:1,2-phenylacetyl-CoA epoxidase catalytic subunit